MAGANNQISDDEASTLAINLIRVYTNRLSIDNQIRKDAESCLAAMVEEDPDRYVVASLLILRQNPDADYRQQASLHIKVLLEHTSILSSVAANPFDAGNTDENKDSQSSPTFWNRLSPDSQELMKRELLSILESQEPTKVVRNAVCDTTSALAGKLLPEGAWPELQPRIFGLLSSDNTPCQVSGLQLLTSLVSELSEVIAKNIPSVHQIMSKLMPSDCADVRYECVNLIAAIVDSEKRSVWRHLQSCIPNIIEILMLSVSQPDDDDALKLLITLIDIGESDAGFFATHLREVVVTLFKIARNTHLTDRIRQLALELVLTMVEGKPKMCKKSHYLVDELLKVLMEFMATIEDDSDWQFQEKETDDESDDELTPNHEIAEGGFDRVANSAGGDVVLPKLFPLVLQYLMQPQWNHRYAAMIAISQTVEHIPEEEIETYLEKIVPICLQQLGDVHPRVRYAACQAIGQAATDTQPLMQETYSATILPALLRTLDDPVFRVQSHAAKALTNFCEEVKASDLAPLLDSLVNKLLQRVALSQPKTVLSSCVTTLAVVAAAVDSLFVKYYPEVVPAMKTIVRHFKAEEDRSCREKALECITLVALAIGKEAFSADTPESMEAILNLWTTSADSQQGAGDGISEGPSEALYDSLCRMCRVLEGDFVVYLPHVMPRVIALLDKKPGPIDLKELAGSASEVCLVRIERGQTLGMKTQITLQFEQVTMLLYTIVATLGNNFRDWISETVESVLPLLEFHYCDKIMQNALNIMAETLKVGRQLADTEENSGGQGSTIHVLNKWMWQTVEQSFAAIEDEQMMIENALEIPRSLASVVKNCGPAFLTDDQVYTLSKKVLQLLDLSCNRSEDIVKGKQEEHDEDDADDLEGEERYELELATGHVEIIGAIIAHHAEKFCSTTAASLAVEFIRARLLEARSPHHASSGGGLPLTVALFVLCELIAMGDQKAEIWTPFTPTLIEVMMSIDPAVRQAAAHGLKLIAKTSSTLTPEMTANATLALLTALEKSDKTKQPLDELEQGAADNVVSALGSVVFKQSGNLLSSVQPTLQPKNLLDVWFNHLPLKADDAEGRLVHNDLVGLVLLNNEEIMGPEMCNIPNLLRIFAHIYKTAFSTDEIDKNLVRIAQNPCFLASVQEMYPKLEKDERKNLEKLFADAQANPMT